MKHRRHGKTKRKRKGGKSRNTKRGTATVSKSSSGGAVMRYLGIAMPERFRTRLRTFCSELVADTSSTFTYGFLGNSFGDGTTGTNGVGPQTNGGGAFTANYPAGLRTFLQTPSGAGSVGLYSQYRIYGSTCEFRVTPRSITATNAPSQYILTQCIPTANQNWTTLQASAFGEQPRCRRLYTPMTVANQTTGIASMTVEGRKVRQHDTTARVLGVPAVIATAPDYASQYNALPSANEQWFWVMQFSSDQPGTTHISCAIEVWITHDVEFFDRNQLASAVNL